MAELVLSRLVRPKRLTRMDLRSGVPPEGKTVCVVSVLLSDPGSAARSAEKLERLYHACGGEKERGALAFGLLADLPGAAERETENDGPALASARAAIDALNARHGGGFCLLTRPRSFDGERWCGRERKRGALCALARLLCGEDSELQAAGDAASLSDAKYILTLDSDTEIYPGEAGWSWYTGSAGWFFRTATENLLGIRRRGGRIVTRRAECALFSLFEARVNGVRAAGEEQKGTTQEPGKMI